MKKGIFVGILFIGIISAFFAVLGPLHEIWHWIYATLSGIDARMGWGVTYMDLSNLNLATAFAGMFGDYGSGRNPWVRLAGVERYTMEL